MARMESSCPALGSNAHVKSVVHSYKGGTEVPIARLASQLNANKVHHALFVSGGVIDSRVR